MGLIFKLIAVLSTLATTALLIVQGVRGGMLLFWSILAVVKLVVMVAFCLVLGLILYALLTSKKPPTEQP
jgi:hypothetical protein